MIKEIDLETYNKFSDYIILRYAEEYDDEEHYSYDNGYSDEDIEINESKDNLETKNSDIYYGIYDDIGNLKSTVCFNRINYSDEYYFPYKFLESYIDYIITLVDCHYSDISYSRELLIYLIDKYKGKIILDMYDSLDYSIIENIFVYNKIMNPYADVSHFEKYKDNFILFDSNQNFLFPFNFNYDLNYLYSLYHKKEMKKVDISRFKFKVLDKNSLYNLLYNYKGYHYNIPLVEESGNSRFLGFHYFTPNDIVSYSNPKNLRFLCCFSNNDYLLGVLKVANYNLSESKYYLGLNYIDVHKSFRNLGIAKGLYKFLNVSYSPDTLLISSDLSDMGKVCQLDAIRKSLVTNFKNFNNNREAQDFLNEFLPTYDYLSNGDNLRTFRLFNFLSRNNCLVNENYLIEKVNFFDKYYLKINFQDSSYYLRSDTIYDIKNKKYLFIRSKSNDYVPVKCFLDFIETLNECNLKKFLKYISTPINICFDLKRNSEFNKI